jgi:hypothetical protein
MNLEKTILDLIYKFREVFANERRVDKYGYANLEDLRAPIQVDIVWVYHEENNLQMMVFDKDKDIDDCKIKIYGPFDIYKQIDKIETIFKENSVLESIEKEFLKSIENIELISPPGCLHKTYNGDNDGFVWSYFNIQNQNMNEIFDTIYTDPIQTFMKRNQINTVAPLPKQTKKTKKAAVKKESRKLKGYAITIFPPIWIGEYPNPSLSQKIHKIPLHRFIKRVIDTHYKGKRLVIKNNGFIAIIEEDKNIALQNLNEILCQMVIAGIDIESGREHQLMKYTMNETGLDESWSQRLGRESSFIQNRASNFSSITEFNFTFSIPQIPIEIMENIVDFAKLFSMDSVICAFTRILLNSYTHYRQSEYSQSFLLSWALMEQILNKQWNLFMDQNTINSKREKKLNTWTIDKKIETLSLVGLIRNDEYDEIMKLKIKRNKFIHCLVSISKEDAMICLNLLKDMAKIMNKHLIPNYSLNS